MPIRIYHRFQGIHTGSGLLTCYFYLKPQTTAKRKIANKAKKNVLQFTVRFFSLHKVETKIKKKSYLTDRHTLSGRKKMRKNCSKKNVKRGCLWVPRVQYTTLPGCAYSIVVYLFGLCSL